jgi:4-amino-4-deoxy-L-arabinose transferase-like glycosyltransferase
MAAHHMAHRPPPVASGVTLPIGALQWAAAVLLVLKAAFIFGVSPVGDEAYYWMWGQNLALSYFDHPPLNAWLQGLVSTVMPWNRFGVRFLAILTFLGTVAVFRVWSRRLAPDNSRQLFWQLLVAYLAMSPVFVFTTITFNDHLLVVLIALSAHFFADYLGKADTEKHPPVASLYLGAFVLGLAGLTKYNAALFGIALVAIIFMFRPYRRLLFSPHLYLAGVVSLAVLSPVLVWNLQNGFASFEYNLSARQAPDWLNDPAWGEMFNTLAASVVGYALFLLPAIWRVFRSGPTTGYPGALRRLGLSALIVSTLGVMVVSLTTRDVAPIYWNIIAFVIILVFAVQALKKRWVFWAHFGVGALAIIILLFNFTVLPVATLSGKPDWESQVLYGWQTLSRRVAAQADAQKPDFIAATRYTTAAQLGFAMGDKNVTALSSRRDQYDFWFDPKARAGQRALIIVDPGAEPDYGSPYVEKRFESLTLLEEVVIKRFGYRLNAFEIYLGENFSQPAPDPPEKPR